jgi:hypothetical protein
MQSLPQARQNSIQQQPMKHLHIFLKCLTFGLLIVSYSVRAHDGEHEGDHGDAGGNCHTNWVDGGDITNQDGQIDGSETLVATIMLVPTNNAPADASGVAKLISDNEDGVITSSFSLTTAGLSADVYTLSVVKISDGSVVTLGQINIGDNSSGSEGENDGNEQGDDQGDEDGGHDGQGKGDGHGSGDDEGDRFLTESDVTLPADLNPADIAQIILSDSNGNAVLVGDFVNPAPTSSIKFKATLRLSGSSKSTKSVNKAQARSTVKKGRRTDRFTMVASKLAPNTVFTISVDGKAAGTVKSNKKGNVMVKKLSANLLTVKSVRLLDAGGNTAAAAKF